MDEEEERRRNRQDQVAVSTLRDGAVLLALIDRLARIGVLSTADLIEVYETALLMLEQAQGGADAATAPLWRLSRLELEARVRKLRG